MTRVHGQLRGTQRHATELYSGYTQLTQVSLVSTGTYGWGHRSGSSSAAAGFFLPDFETLKRFLLFPMGCMPCGDLSGAAIFPGYTGNGYLKLCVSHQVYCNKVSTVWQL